MSVDLPMLPAALTRALRAAHPADFHTMIVLRTSVVAYAAQLRAAGLSDARVCTILTEVLRAMLSEERWRSGPPPTALAVLLYQVSAWCGPDHYATE